MYQSQNQIDLGRSLGFSKLKSLYSLILPSARPAIVAGLSLVAMETLAEFGAVDFFSMYRFSTLFITIKMLLFVCSMLSCC